MNRLESDPDKLGDYLFYLSKKYDVDKYDYVGNVYKIPFNLRKHFIRYVYDG